MKKNIDIGNRKVGENQPAFIIAEIGANHNGDINIAKKLIDEAKRIGCDCAKFQTFTATEFCADPTQLFTYKSQGKEVTEPIIDLFKRLEFTQAQWEELVSYCESVGIIFSTTIQDPVNLKMMQKMGLPAIKVGSDDFDHLINLKHYAETGIPLILSKGMSDLAEIDRTIQHVKKYTDKLAILHCVSLYPTEAKYLNISQLVKLQNLYPDVIWGFSDHSQGTLASVIAVSLGARIIEKHFTLSHDAPGPDHWFSMDISEMERLVKDIRFTESALGDGEISITEEELASKTLMRRKLVAKKDLDAGEKLTEETVSFKRSDSGLFLSHWDLVEGNIIGRAIKKDEGIELKDISFEK